MNNKFYMCLLLFPCLIFHTQGYAQDKPIIHMAVEFVDHAATAYIASNKGWFQQEGLDVIAFDNYITGMALSSALGRGNINAAYICLAPAICAYANAKVPIKIVAGTHRYGYGLLVDSNKVATPQDLEKPNIRIGCSREGSPVDILLHKLIERCRLNAEEILPKVRRMPSPNLLLALKTGRIDAAFCCEQFATMGESLGFKELISAQDLWPEMQGSVLVVRQDLIEKHPDVVRRLVEITKRGIGYIQGEPDVAARIVADALTISGREVFPVELAGSLSELNISAEIIKRSLSTKMKNTEAIDPQQIQETIDYMAQLGYLRKSFPAEQILDLRFLK